VIERAVARDTVEPRANVDVALVREDGIERGDEDLLQDVLGILTLGEHVPAERQQAGLVAGEERLEGHVLTATGHGNQTLVRLKAQQRGRAAKARQSPSVC
jgi:hypothetical protein